MRGLLNSLADFPEFADATSENNLSRSHNLVTPPPSFPFLIAQIAQSRPVLVVALRILPANFAIYMIVFLNFQLGKRCHMNV